MTRRLTVQRHLAVIFLAGKHVPAKWLGPFVTRYVPPYAKYFDWRAPTCRVYAPNPADCAARLARRKVLRTIAITPTHFLLTLILLGVGWNFGFLGVSALVLECHRPEERTRVQSLNDFVVFGTMAAGSFSAGGLFTAYGWQTVL